MLKKHDQFYSLMKNTRYPIFCLALLCCSSVLSFAQQKPAGYYTAVLSRYEYQGKTIQKNDRIPLQGNDTMTVKEIQKYRLGYSDVYYATGKNNAGRKVYYSVASLFPADSPEKTNTAMATEPAATKLGIFPAENNKIIYEQRSEAPGLEAAVLYDNTLSHLVNTHRDGGIRLQDYALGHFIVSDWDTLSYIPLFDSRRWKEVKLSYLCDILVKEGKFRIRLYDIGLECISSGDEGSMFLSPEELAGPAAARFPGLAEALDRRCRHILETLVQAIAKPADTGW